MDYNKIITDSLDASRKIVGKSWKTIKPYAESEFMDFIQNAEQLARLKLSGEITEEELAKRIIIQRTSLTNVLLTIEGISLITAQNIVNAILGIVSEAIFTALKVVLPI